MDALGPFRDMARTVIYGVDSCEDTTRARQWLVDADLPFRYVDLDAANDTRASLHALGLTSTPVVVTPDGRVEIEPSDEALDELFGASNADPPLASRGDAHRSE